VAEQVNTHKHQIVQLTGEPLAKDNMKPHINKKTPLHIVLLYFAVVINLFMEYNQCCQHRLGALDSLLHDIIQSEAHGLVLVI
jgi:predicted RND superfamily exporter protein